LTNNTINEKFKEIIKLALQDENESNNIFKFLKQILVKDNIKMYSKLQEASNLPLDVSDPTILKQTILTLFGFIARYHSDFITVLDFLDTINQNNLETRKTIRNLAEDVSKHKITVDEAMRVIIEMFNKKDEQIQFAIKELKSEQGFYKWFKRYYEDKARDLEKNE
jgi:hypothetical protein